MKLASNSQRRARPLLGTFVEITAEGTPHDGETAHAIDAAFDAVTLVHRLMSFHERGSDVSRLNREGGYRPVAVHPWTYQVLEAAMDLQHQSTGRFDITVAPALQALRLLPATDGAPARTVTPGALEGSSVILLPGHRVRLRHPALRIALCGIAKGFAVDQAVNALRARGISSGLVNGGGDIAAFGPRAHRVCVRHPSQPARILSQVDLRNEGLASSGPRLGPDRVAGHAGAAIVDPTTGKAVTNIVGATVRASTCMMADALTKPVMICSDSSLRLLDRCCASALLVRRDGDVRATSNWQEATDRAA